MIPSCHTNEPRPNLKIFGNSFLLVKNRYFDDQGKKKKEKKRKEDWQTIDKGTSPTVIRTRTKKNNFILSHTQVTPAVLPLTLGLIWQIPFPEPEKKSP